MRQLQTGYPSPESMEEIRENVKSVKQCKKLILLTKQVIFCTAMLAKEDEKDLLARMNEDLEQYSSRLKELENETLENSDNCSGD